MSGPPPLSSTNSAVWAGAPDNFYDGQSSTGPVPLGGAATTLPVVNNPNLPPNAGSVFNRPPPTVPRMPLTPFPQLQRPPIGAANSTASPPFDPASNFNSMPPRMVHSLCSHCIPDCVCVLKITPSHRIQHKRCKMKLMNVDCDN